MKPNHSWKWQPLTTKAGKDQIQENRPWTGNLLKIYLSYWHDQESGWIHIKLYEHGDRTKGGNFTEHFNDCVTDEDTGEETCTVVTTGPNLIGDSPNFLGLDLT